MGCFSWIDCKGQTNVTTGGAILLPACFKGKYEKGRPFISGNYNGYGVINGTDIYDVAAILNICYCSDEEFEKTLLAAELQRPTLAKYGGLFSYEKEELRSAGLSEKEIEERDTAERNKYYTAALKHFSEQKNLAEKLRALYLETPSKTNIFDDIYAADDALSSLQEGKEGRKIPLRELGIFVACYDEQNASLPYPIKVTTDEAGVYEDELFSMSDPCQGMHNISKRELKEVLHDRKVVLTETLNHLANKAMEREEIER